MILIGKDSENPMGHARPRSGRAKMISEVMDGMVMPGIQGGPLMHVDRRQGRGFQGGP